MRIIILTILFLFSSILFGQKKKQKKIYTPFYNPAVDIFTGYRIMSNDFYNQLNSTTNFNTDKPLMYVGLGFSDHFFGPFSGFIRQLSYTQIIPQPIKINDSLNCDVRGFVSSYCFSITIFKKSKFFRCYFGMGINAGRLKLNEENIINKTSTILTPKISLLPIFFIKRIYISLSIEYDYDFFKPSWTNHGDNQFNALQLNKLAQTSLSAQFRLGFFLKKQK